MEPAGNPFHALRPATEGVILSWHDISLTVAKGKQLLSGITGQAAPGRLLAVMGASGAGKTTFLNVLAQRVRGFSGSVLVNGGAVDASFNRLVGYVTQEAPLLDTLTVRETLLFAARLRLPESISHADKCKRVDDVITQLDLTSCQHTYVGKATEPGGISGGERRRLTLGMELLYDPYVLLCDEVTSGLDASSAFRIVRILRMLAHTQQRTIICTIHQPRANILTAFDSLLLLAGGMTVYYGPTWREGHEDGMLQYFRDAGYPFPAFTNPADAVIDLVNDEHSTLTTSTEEGLSGDTAEQAVVVHVDASGTGAREAENAEPEHITIPASPTSSRALVSSRDMMSARTLGRRDAVRVQLAQRYASSALAVQAATLPAVLPPPAKPRYGIAGRKYPTSWCTQFSVIAERAFLFKLRNPDAVATQFFGSVLISVIIGSVFYKLPLTTSGITDRLAAISFMILTQSFMAFDIVVLAPFERSVMLRDAASGMYSTASYYCGRTAAEAPVHTLFGALVGIITYWMFGLQADVAKFFTYVLVMVLVTQAGASALLLVGAMSQSMAMGNALATLVLVFASLFNGFFIHAENTPPVYRWIAEIAFPAFGVKAAVVNEFTGLVVACTADERAAGCTGSGTAQLASLGFGNINAWTMCWYLLAEIVIFRVLAYMCMHFLYTGQSLRQRVALLLPGA